MFHGKNDEHKEQYDEGNILNQNKGKCPRKTVNPLDNTASSQSPDSTIWQVCNDTDLSPNE
jgi:hypothetical protein